MNVRNGILALSVAVTLFAGLAVQARAPKPIKPGEKATVEGMIEARNGDMLHIKQAKTGDLIIVNLTDATVFNREKSWGRRSEMDVTAMLPGLTIKAEGVGNEAGQVNAKTIYFHPDAFDITVAQQKQIEANQAAAAKAQGTANTGVAAAAKAQGTADQAGAAAQGATTLAMMDAEAVSLVNKRVSDLGDYKTIAVGSVFFETGKADLSAADKQALDTLAKDVKSLPNYMLEVAGYASSTGTKELNQKLSEERAAAVTTYLRNSANIPMRRFLVPAGYGATHPDAKNTDPKGREINRRVDVTILVNKGLAE